MNPRDRKEFEERLNNPEFSKVYDEYLTLLLRMKLLLKKNNVFMTADMPMAHELKVGQQTTLFLSGPGFEQIKPSIMKLYQEVESLARSLSAFFPETQRWRWQEVFISQAFGGTGAVAQRQAGGRRTGTVDKERKGNRIRMASHYLKIKAEYKARGERRFTYSEFVKAHGNKYDECSVSTLRRAVVEYKQIYKGMSKESPAD